jgi:hypothetical protein
MNQPQNILVGITWKDETTWYKAHSFSIPHSDGQDDLVAIVRNCGANRTPVEIPLSLIAGVVPGDVDTGENPGILEWNP